MNSILLFGAGGHAKVLIDIIEKSQAFRIEGLVADAGSAATDCGYPLVSEAEAQKISATYAVVAVGDNFKRAKISEDIRKNFPLLKFATLIHPSAIVGRGVSLGEGTVVMAGAVLNPFVKSGRHCIFNTASSVDHDCNLEDFVSLAPGAVVGGDCVIGQGVAISIGASVSHGRKIGAGTVVGTGAVVVEDLPELVVAYGNPCRVVRPRKDGEKYL